MGPNDPIASLIGLLSRLPGIGERTLQLVEPYLAPMSREAGDE